MAFPIKLDDGYTCRGKAADGATIVFEDLLYEGELVADHQDADGNHYGPMHTVVRRDDGLWVE